MSFYTKIQTYLVERRKSYNSLKLNNNTLLNSETLGRFYENLIHEEIKRIIPKIYKIYRGIIIILNNQGNIVRYGLRKII